MCIQVKKQQLELDMEQQTGSKWEKEYVKAVGSLLFSPGSWCTQGFVCALQESVSQSWVSSGGSMVRLMATSSKRAYALCSLYHNHVSMLHYSQTKTSLLKLILLFLSMYIMHIKNLQWRNELGN